MITLEKARRSDCMRTFACYFNNLHPYKATKQLNGLDDSILYIIIM